MQPSLSELEARLDPARFFRISRAAIVNLDAVREVGRSPMATVSTSAVGVSKRWSIVSGSPDTTGIELARLSLRGRVVRRDVFQEGAPEGDNRAIDRTVGGDRDTFRI